MSDMYTEAASALFNKPVSEITPGERKAAKIAIYMNLYARPGFVPKAEEESLALLSCGEHEWPVIMTEYTDGKESIKLADDPTCPYCDSPPTMIKKMIGGGVQ